MVKKIALIVCLASLFLASGCQESQKPKALIEVIKNQQAKDLSYGVDTTSNIWMAAELSPRDIAIARRPGIEQTLYLPVVDKEGKEVNCSRQPMKVVVENDGKLALECSSFEKFTPAAVENGKVVVE